MPPWRSRRLGHREMPTLVYAGVLFSTLFEAAWVGAVILALFVDRWFGSGVTLRFGTTTYHPTDLAALPLIAQMIAITWGFWTERLWARHFAVAFWIGAAGAGIALPLENTSWSSVAGTIAFAAFAAWYLFGARATTAYYEKLAARVYRRSVPTRPMRPAPRRG